MYYKIRTFKKMKLSVCFIPKQINHLYYSREWVLILLRKGFEIPATCCGFMYESFSLLLPLFLATTRFLGVRLFLIAHLDYVSFMFIYKKCWFLILLSLSQKLYWMKWAAFPKFYNFLICLIIYLIFIVV